jgi:hypothetical protein
MCAHECGYPFKRATIVTPINITPRDPDLREIVECSGSARRRKGRNIRTYINGVITVRLGVEALGLGEMGNEVFRPRRIGTGGSRCQDPM